MRMSDLSIRNPVFAWMLMAGMMVFGLVGASRMGLSQLPDVDFPVVTVTITFDGAAPEVIEASIADPLEDQLMSVEGLRTLTTISTVGSIAATLEFDLSRNVEDAVQETETRTTAAQKLFPPNVDPPVITKTNPDDQPIIWLALSSEKASFRDLMLYSRNIVKDQFTSLPGVGNVLLGGYIEPAMRVWIKPQELNKRNIAVTDVISTLTRENIELPGGDFDEGNTNYNLRTLGEASTPEDFGSIVVAHRAGQENQDPTHLVHLRDIARIEPGVEEITRLSRFNGVQAVGLGIVKQKGTNAVAIADQVKAKVAEISKFLPPGYKLGVNFDTTKFISESVHELVMNLILSAILTAIACWVFLGSLSATFNVVLSIPTSILGAFIVLYFFGFTLNTFTLLGLSLAIGIVVDDSIMVLENIFRHNEEGKPRIQAAIIGAREITFAALAATIAIVAIFLPVAFMKGIIGKFFYQFGVTITATVLLSLVEALTITPMRLSQFGEVHKRTDWIGRNFELFMEYLRVVYAKTLAYCLKHPWKVVIVATAIMLASLSSTLLLKREFSPAQDQSLFLLRYKTSTDASIAKTDAIMKQVEAWLHSREEVTQYYTTIGGFGGASSAYNAGTVFVTMRDYSDRPKDPDTHKRLSQQQFMAVARAAVQKIDPTLSVNVQDLSMRGFTATRGFPIEFTLRGEEWDQLDKISTQMMNEMRANKLVTDLDTDYLAGKPQVELLPDREQAGLHGVSTTDIGNTLSAMIGGMRVNQYTEKGHRYYVWLQVDKDYQNMNTLKSLLVNNARNNLIPMRETLKETVTPSMQSITRIDRERAISIYANPAPGHSQQEAIDYITGYQKKLPPGYRIVLSGTAQTFKESFDSLIVALLLGLFVAYMVLASQFNSFIDPISVLVALPFSLSGAFIGLLLAHQSLNIYSMIGLILLMGIVKKNSILLVDFTNAVRDRGQRDVKKALLEACPVRLRPILMTSFACITAAIPEAFPFGVGSETNVPMAVSIIGGVTVSTFLTLYVVPCVYELFSRIQKREQNLAEIKTAFLEVGEEGNGG